jgi:lipid-A-disaccharide synthase-like uncharacterized protein
MEQLFALLNVNSYYEFWWVVFGLGGQALFMSRFLVQWFVSEREGRSVIPIAFWYFSIGGALILLTYGFHRGEPIIIVGQSTGLIIYLRNLWLIHRERAQQAPVPEA